MLMAAPQLAHVHGRRVLAYPAGVTALLNSCITPSGSSHTRFYTSPSFCS